MNHADVTFTQNEFVLTGNLDFSNVVAVYKKALPQFKSASSLVFNFADLKTSNSAGLALMIEWMKRAKAANKPLEFRNVSPGLQSIAKAAGLDLILPVGV